ncbi:MAG TPA: hypothetical protein VGG27_14685 [Magnetospirillaceae bacterium]
MNRIPIFGLLAVCAIALSGCASQERTFEPSDPRIKIDGYYNDGVGGRDVKLKVIGVAFGAQPDAFRQALEADLQSESVLGRQPTHVVLTPGPSGKRYYRLAYAFNQPNAVYGNALCQIAESDAVQAPPSNIVNATAAFCVGGEAEAYISGQTEATGPDDPRFRQLVRQMMDQVFRPDVRQEASPPPGARTN